MLQGEQYLAEGMVYVMNIALLATVSQIANSTSSDSGQSVNALGLGVSVISSVITGGVVTAFWQGHQQRIRDLRESWLTASDAFLTAATRGLVALKKLEPRQDKDSGGQRRGSRRNLRDDLELSVGKGWMKDTGDKVAEATERFRRIQLLFGPKSPTAQDGNRCVEQLEIAWFSISSSYKAVRAIELNQAARQVAWRQLVPRQLAPPQVAPRDTRRWGIEWLRQVRLRFASWLLGWWRQGIRWLRWSQVAPPQEAPAEVAQESVSVVSVMQELNDLIVDGLPLMRYGSNVMQYFQRYQEQRSLKDLQQEAETDYRNAVREADNSLGQFTYRVSGEIDRLQHRPRVRQEPMVYSVTADEKVKAKRASGWLLLRLRISSLLHPWGHIS
jgi:hypothetical protein